MIVNDKEILDKMNKDKDYRSNILIDLNISANTAKKVYLELIDDKNF